MIEILSEAEKIERVEKVVVIMQDTQTALAEQYELIDSLRQDEEPHPSIDDIVEAFVAGHMGKALKGRLRPIRRELKKQAKRDYKNQAVQSLARHLRFSYCSHQDTEISRLLGEHYLRAEVLEADGPGISVRYAKGRDPRDIPGLYPEGKAKGMFLNTNPEWGIISLDNSDIFTVEVIDPQTRKQQVELEIVH